MRGAGWVGGSATYHNHFPEQKQDLLYGEVGSQATAELGNHGEKQKGKRFLIMHGEAWGRGEREVRK